MICTCVPKLKKRGDLVSSIEDIIFLHVSSIPVLLMSGPRLHFDPGRGIMQSKSFDQSDGFKPN